MTQNHSAFAVRDFRLVTQARFLFGLGVQIQAVLIGWQIYEIKHDPLYLGLTGLVEALPALTLALFAGEIVDRSNPLAVYKNVLRLSLLAGLLLMVGSYPTLHLTNSHRVILLYLAAFITGTARGFASPALFALIPQLVKREALRISSAWTTVAFQVASVSGPALGGFLYAWKGGFVSYGFQVASLLGALASVSGIKHKPQLRLVEKRLPVIQNIQEGIRFVFSNQVLLSALALDMFAVLFGGAVAILPIFAGEILHTGPRGLGILRAAPAVGAFIMSALLIRFPVGKNAGRILLSVVTGFGLCMIAFAFSKIFLLSVLVLAASGALDSVSMVIRQAIVQLSSPENMRGRIAAVNSVFIGSSNEIGAFESGLAAKLLGTVPSVVFGGVMTLLTVGITAALAPKLRKMDLTEL